MAKKIYIQTINHIPVLWKINSTEIFHNLFKQSKNLPMKNWKSLMFLMTLSLRNFSAPFWNTATRSGLDSSSFFLILKSKIVSSKMQLVFRVQVLFFTLEFKHVEKSVTILNVHCIKMARKHVFQQWLGV